MLNLFQPNTTTTVYTFVAVEFGIIFF
jgi:hypothetical protein